MKRKPRWTLEMLTASLAVLCGLLLLVLLVQRPTAWLLLAVLVVLWGIGATLFRCKLRRWVVRWTSGTTFEKSKVQFSLEPLSQPAALLSGETVLWYNSQFRTRLLGGQDVLASRVQKLLPGLDLQLCRKREGQLLTLADGYWSVHSSTVPGEAESVTLLVLNEETALRKEEAEYTASRPGYLVFLVDGYDEESGQFYGRTFADSPDIDGRVWIASDERVHEGDFVMVKIDGCTDGDLCGYVVEEEA